MVASLRTEADAEREDGDEMGVDEAEPAMSKHKRGMSEHNPALDTKDK